MAAWRNFAGLIAAALAVGATASDAQTAPADSGKPPLASPQPVALFKAVCIDGTASLSRSWAKSTNFRAMPPEAKAAIGKTDDEVPNPAFQIGGGNEFLLLPAPAPGPAFADACAVVWQGNNLAEAQKMIPLAGPGTIVTATATKGWVLLTSLSKPDAPATAPSR